MKKKNNIFNFIKNNERLPVLSTENILGKYYFIKQTRKGPGLIWSSYSLSNKPFLFVGFRPMRAYKNGGYCSCHSSKQLETSYTLTFSFYTYKHSPVFSDVKVALFLIFPLIISFPLILFQEKISDHESSTLPLITSIFNSANEFQLSIIFSAKP